MKKILILLTACLFISSCDRGIELNSGQILLAEKKCEQNAGVEKALYFRKNGSEKLERVEILCRNKAEFNLSAEDMDPFKKTE